MHIRRLIQAFAGHTYYIVGNLMLRLKFEPLYDKRCLTGFGQSNNKIRLLNYRAELEKLNFTSYKFRSDTFDHFPKTNDKSADRSAQMRRLVFDFVVPNPRRQVFLCRCPNLTQLTIKYYQILKL